MTLAAPSPALWAQNHGATRASLEVAPFPTPHVRRGEQRAGSLQPGAATRRPCAHLTLQVHLVQLSTTQVSFSAKNLPSCKQADMFLVLGGPPMSSQRNRLSFDWKVEGRRSAQSQQALQPSHAGECGTCSREGASGWTTGDGVPPTTRS